MTAFLLVAVGLCVGGMLGASWTTQALGAVSRRHAAERKNLNQSWRELAAARRSSSTAFCPNCDSRMTDPGWLLVVEQSLDEEDDGT